MTPLSTPAAQGTVALSPLALVALEHRRQLDADGVEIAVSRQAFDELLAAYKTAVDRVNRATDAEIGGIHRSFAPSPEALPASGVEAPEYVVGVGELGPKGHVYYVLSGGGMGEAVARVYPGPDAERMAKVMAAALTSAPAPEDRT